MGGRLFDGDGRSVGKGEREGQGLKKIWEQKTGHDKWRIWETRQNRWSACQWLVMEVFMKLNLFEQKSSSTLSEGLKEWHGDS